MEISFRIGRAEDAEAISKIVQESLGEDFKPRKISPAIVREKINDRKDVFILAAAGEKIIGVSRASYEDVDLAEIRWLAVSEGFRNRGIGTGLVEKTVEMLKGKGRRKVTARIRSSSAIPLKIFSESGFEKEGHFREHYRKGVDIIQFGKIL